MNANPTPDQPVSLGRRHKFSWRGFTSMVIAWAFLLLSVTGVILFITPRGRDARWTDWEMLGLGKEQWGSMHVNISILFLIFATLHLVLNWRVFWSYLRKRSQRGIHLRRELALATVGTALFVAGVVYNAPPFSTLMDYQHDIKNYWSYVAANQYQANPADSLALTRSAGSLCEQNCDTTDDSSEQHQGFGGGRGMGMGMGGGGMGMGRGMGGGMGWMRRYASAEGENEHPDCSETPDCAEANDAGDVDEPTQN